MKLYGSPGSIKTIQLLSLIPEIDSNIGTMRLASTGLKAAFFATLLFENVVVATTKSSLSSALLDVASGLGKTQPQADISPVVELVKKNEAKMNQISTNKASNTATACDVFDTLFPGKYSNKTSSDYTVEVQRPMYVLEKSNMIVTLD